METVTLDVDDSGVATVTLADEENGNALSSESGAELHEHVLEAARDPDVAVILLRGEGPAFCVGGAIGEFAEAGDEAHDLLVRIGDVLNPTIRALHDSDKLVIAAVHGSVAGGGVGLMAAADLILAAEGTVFTLGYAKLGTTPDAGVTWFLVRDLGYRRALELYLTSERFDAARALELGMVNRVVAADELEEESTALAARLAAGPRTALAQGKRLFRQAAADSLARQLDDEIRTFADNTRHPDFRAGVEAFLAKEEPQFNNGRVLEAP